jgi:hypothetical protein
MVAEAKVLDDDDDDDDDEEEIEDFFDENDPEEILAHQRPIVPKEEDAFPADCLFLYKVQDLMMNKKPNGTASVATAGVLLTTSTSLLTLTLS